MHEIDTCYSPHFAWHGVRYVMKPALRFEGKLGQKPEYTGRVFAVGIAYDKDDKTKQHECRVEVLREKLE